MTGTDTIATVNYHSSFSHQCCPPPWTNISPLQIRRATTNQLSSSHSQLQPSLVQASLSTHAPSSLNQFSQPTLLISSHTDLDPALFQPRPDIIFHLRHSILPLSTSFIPISALPPRHFCRNPASLHKPTSQSPSFHQPRHTLHFSILSILLILSKTSTHSTQSTRLSSSLFVYFVYFVVQIFDHTPIGRTLSFLAILCDHMINTGFNRSSMERLSGLSPHRLGAASPAALRAAAPSRDMTRPPGSP